MNLMSGDKTLQTVRAMSRIFFGENWCCPNTENGNRKFSQPRYGLFRSGKRGRVAEFGMSVRQHIIAIIRWHGDSVAGPSYSGHSIVADNRPIVLTLKFEEKNVGSSSNGGKILTSITLTDSPASAAAMIFDLERRFN